jgi:hypothetical protein
LAAAGADVDEESDGGDDDDANSTRGGQEAPARAADAWSATSPRALLRLRISFASEKTASHHPLLACS